jgi:aspartate carbamoyltransferase catalytic subunit
MELSNRHLLEIADLTLQDISFIFDSAKKFKALDTTQKEIPASLKGKIVANIFFEPSTRTRVSFEIASKKLGADIVNIGAGESSVKKGETLLDTLLTLEAMGCDLFIIRHAESGVPHQLSRYLKTPIINAGDGVHAHPTQALLDAMTLIDKWGMLKGKEITIVGDIIHNRAAKSCLELFSRLGAIVTFCGPEVLVPLSFKELGAKIQRDLKIAIKNADAVYMIRMQQERWETQDYWNLMAKYQFKREHLNLLREKAFVMAPGPINRGVEIESFVADSERSLILDQVKWGLYTRMSILHMIGRADHLRGSTAGANL